MGTTQALHQDAHRFGPAAPDEEYVYGSRAPGWHAAVVHGLSGLGRTGQVLAGWLAYDRGYRSDRAVRIVQECGRDPTITVTDRTVTEQDLFELLETVRG
jgi:hypothetical protein